MMRVHADGEKIPQPHQNSLLMESELQLLHLL